MGRTVVNLFFLLSQWHPGKRQSSCKAVFLSLSQQSLGKRQEDRSPVQCRAHTPFTHTPNNYNCSLLGSQQWALSACLSFSSLFLSIIWERTQTGGPWPCRTILRLLRISRSTFMVVQLNETPMHHYHPSINKNCLSVIELNLSSHEFSICARKNTLDWSSHFIRRGSETQDRPADKLQWLTQEKPTGKGRVM